MATLAIGGVPLKLAFKAFDGRNNGKPFQVKPTVTLDNADLAELTLADDGASGTLADKGVLGVVTVQLSAQFTQHNGAQVTLTDSVGIEIVAGDADHVAIEVTDPTEESADAQRVTVTAEDAPAA